MSILKEAFDRWRKDAGRLSTSALWCLVFLVLISSPLSAQTSSSPWELIVEKLRVAFTGSIARGLAAVAIVLGGLQLAFGEGHDKRVIAGVIFGAGMAVLSVNFMSWLFGV